MQSRQSIELRQHQQLALTPQLQQALRFLQASAQDFEQEVADALLENPLLEREEEYDIDIQRLEPEADDEREDSRLLLSIANRPRVQGDDGAARPETSQAETLQDHLLAQLRVTRLSRRDQAFVELLIGELDDNGYLVGDLAEIAECLPDGLGVDPDELATALSLLQSFDPPGVGARSLSECLLIQLQRRQGALRPEVLACARDLAQNHLALLASGNLARLRERLACSPGVLREAHQVLLALEPKPGRELTGALADHVIPEIIVRKRKEQWEAQLNPAAMPRLRVNSAYEQAIREQGVNEQPVAQGAASLQQKIREAHGTLKSVNQRFETILRVAQAVVAHQQDFFHTGVQAMRPLNLREIADELGMHESTVSRATRFKYAQTPWGLFELKYFFGSGLDTDQGEMASATAVKALIQDLVAAETAVKPLSDSQLAVKLGERGVVIARRTVAKYREAAGIESAALRKAKALLAQEV